MKLTDVFAMSGNAGMELFHTTAASNPLIRGQVQSFQHVLESQTQQQLGDLTPALSIRQLLHADTGEVVSLPSLQGLYLTKEEVISLLKDGNTLEEIAAISEAKRSEVSEKTEEPKTEELEIKPDETKVSTVPEELEELPEFLVQSSNLEQALLPVLQQLLESLSIDMSEEGLQEMIAAEEIELLQLIPVLKQAVQSDQKIEALFPLIEAEVNQPEQELHLPAFVQALEAVLNKWSSSQQNSQVSPTEAKHMLILLERWIQLNPAAQKVINFVAETKWTEQEKAVWNKLLINYQTRKSMSSQTGYTKEVTAQDITKWIKHALEQTKGMEALGSRQTDSSFIYQQPLMSKAQHYVIHLQQTNTEQQAVQNQLIQQFQRVMQKSNFMQFANGNSQLTIQLRPENLGDITVRLVQMNGEMMVKMLVTSQTTKELLETNMNQLRHLFSPQQVTIERQEAIASQTTENLTKDQDDSQEQEEQQDQPKENPSFDESAQDFHEILMEMKV
ncbi:flagellar hook-length control protein FliK [Gracilibacillus alcaliphilus]|uniref:flagellar hook-length control protein FliK n=1 Tax=Gracilibacillus alcaliphilus TaxID=1401441 RepID=UPI00195C965D|nr:flagellar hook-length control protein FliK [Gracilibacillus alcaliphilus]MBM7677937.1 flagellar hook-length control protein FliK [Gracilibacillus alcaliphilus]